MAKAAHWTDTKLEALRPFSGKSERRASIDNSLYLRLRDRPQRGGLSRTWEYRAQIDGKRKYLSLGEYSRAQGLAWARAKLATLHGKEDQARKGEADHPAITERHKRGVSKSDPTVAELFDRWIADLRLLKRRASTISLQGQNFDGDIRNRIGDAKVSKLDADALRACVNAPKKRGRLGQAAQVYKTLRGLLSYAIAEGYIKADPMAAVKNPKPYNPQQGGANAAEDSDIVALYKTLDGDSLAFRTVKLAIKFQLLTGTRPTEAREAVWAEIDSTEKIWRLPAERVKTNRAFKIHLSPQACAVLEEAAELSKDKKKGYIFPGKTAACLSKTSIDRALSRMTGKLTKAGGKKLTPQDLRRSFRTLLSRIGVAPHVAERCVNHVDPSAMVRAYDAFDYWGDMVDGWNRAGAHIEAITQGAAQVVPIRAA